MDWKMLAKRRRCWTGKDGVQTEKYRVQQKERCEGKDLAAKGPWCNGKTLGEDAWVAGGRRVRTMEPEAGGVNFRPWTNFNYKDSWAEPHTSIRSAYSPTQAQYVPSHNSSYNSVGKWVINVCISRKCFGVCIL